MAHNNNNLVTDIVAEFDSYHFKKIKSNRFLHNELIEAINSFQEFESLTINTLGYSEEGREIKSVTYGKGKIKILLWSQMHGNESTATRALLDLFNFFTANDEFNVFRKSLANNLTLQFIPMLNPDGAERFQRRTSTEIDMNRDAIELQTPEGRLLTNLVDSFKPNFGFNLHDQRRFYNVSNTDVPSSISFLAPAYNKARELNDSRAKAMQLIAGMNEQLQQIIPGGVGLYDDTYSHRSFGDTIQSKGVSTVLIESGWIKGDMEKEQIRVMNFAALLKAFAVISSNNLDNFSVEQYNQIPAIDTKLFDVLIKNAGSDVSSQSRIDVGINRTEHLLIQPNYFSIGQIDDLGDLSSFYGFETIDAKGLTIVKGKSIYIKNLEEVSMVSVKRRLRQGIIFLLTEEIPFESHVPYPINVVHPRKLKVAQQLVFEGKANFLLVDKDDRIKYIMLNGFLMTPDKINTSANGLVLV